RYDKSVDHEFIKPKVTVYPALKPGLNGNTTLLCLAKDMFPDLVKISWKMVDENGTVVKVSEEKTEVLEQTDEGQMTSMIIIKEEKADVNKYICWVTHEAGFNIDEGTPSLTYSTVWRHLSTKLYFEFTYFKM
uniref:Ig-like domain-containing protein n=1 Tax=Esox lucius TaxID=8010 RepID=A0A3P8YPH1_ESOLU